MSQSDDMEAINRYMRTTPIKAGLTEPFTIKDRFIKWYDGLGWWDRSQNSDAYDTARTYRNQFNIANQPNEQAKQEVRQVIATGQTTEQMQGKPKPKIDAQTGRVGTQVTKPTVQATKSTQPKPGQPLAPSEQGSAPVPLTRNLVMGMTDGGKGDINAWQIFLGIVPPTGYYGQQTVDKTIAFQKSKGLSADGKVGPATWAAAFPPSAKPAVAPDAFAPEPAKPKPAALKPAAPKPASGGGVKPSPAPTPQPKESAAKKVANKVKEKAKSVKEAGVLDPGGWPTWAKVMGLITIVGAALAAATGVKPRSYLLGDKKDNT